MEKVYLEGKFALVLPLDKEFSKTKTVGVALKFSDVDYYILKFNLLYKDFFLSRNRDSNQFYTVFSRRTDRGRDGKLQCVVGRGTLNDLQKDYLKIELDLLCEPVYMNLFPLELKPEPSFQKSDDNTNT